MRQRILLGAALAAILLGAISSYALFAIAQTADGSGRWGPGMMGGYGPGMMGAYGPGMMGSYGPGMMGGYGPGMMGPWMMGRSGGMGPGMMGWGWNGPPTNLDLSANDVKSYLQNWIASSGNAHIKVGNVAEKDANTVTADIVTTDKDGLVQRFNIDRHTGLFRPAEG